MMLGYLWSLAYKNSCNYILMMKTDPYVYMEMQHILLRTPCTRSIQGGKPHPGTKGIQHLDESCTNSSRVAIWRNKHIFCICGLQKELEAVLASSRETIYS